MLVLSRRLNEKIIFPDLGIELELVASRNQVARIAIDAPRSIRIIRGEIADQHRFWHEREEDAKAISKLELDEELDVETVQNHIDTANLALYLAQNQLQADRSEYAEETLEAAIEAMQQLNDLFKQHPDWKEHLPVSHHVREDASGYQVGSSEAWLVAEPSTEMVSTNAPSDLFVELENQGFRLTSVTPKMLLRRFASQQPDVLFIQTACVSDKPLAGNPPAVFQDDSRMRWCGHRSIVGQTLATWKKR